jgi:hypothetical protein
MAIANAKGRSMANKMFFVCIETATTLSNEKTDPIDKSSEPLITTSVKPQLIIEMTDTCFSMLIKLAAEANFGVVTERIMSRNMSMTNCG